MTRQDKEIFSYLLTKELIPVDILNKAVERTEAEGISLTEILVRTRYLSESDLLKNVAVALNLEFVDLRAVTVAEDVLSQIPPRLASHYKIMPLNCIGNKLTVASNRPIGVKIQDEIHFALGRDLKVVLAITSQIEKLLRSGYGLGADTIERLSDENKGVVRNKQFQSLAEVEIEDLDKQEEKISVVQLVNQIILDACDKRATDIHIEPYRGKLRIRFRIDGVLRDQNVPPRINNFSTAIFSRIKVMSNLNIVEHRIPQDGRAVVRTNGKTLDLRISVMPTSHGESMVIRVLSTKLAFDLEKLGLSDYDVKTITQIISGTGGIIFVTGPTGSGKTTTLYACLKKINKKERKIITIEDPVEYEMDNVTQIQVNAEVGLTFSAGLRSVLRHDPDIVMVGEVRDKETAEIAIRVALTGHLVFSTLHTNDAVSSIMRLIDIGIEPYLIASSVDAFMAQRLVRVVCPECKEEDTSVDKESIASVFSQIGIKLTEKSVFYKGKGCDYCGFTGFSGRTALYEILVLNDEIKHMITKKMSVNDIRQRALKNGMRTLLHDGWDKIIKGQTTFEEVLNVCQGSEHGVKDMITANKTFDETGKSENSTSISEQRIFARAFEQISLSYRVISKGDGEILKLNKKEKHDADKKEVFLHVVTEVATIEDISDDKHKVAFAITSDISAGGLLFNSEYFLPKDTVIEVRIYIEDESNPVLCLAKVVRAEKYFSEGFKIAICYLDISGHDRSRLNKFMNKKEG